MLHPMYYNTWSDYLSVWVEKVSATEMLDLGLISGRIKPKTIQIGIYSFLVLLPTNRQEAAWLKIS